MTAVIVLLALSALIGFALGTSFSWLAVAASSTGIAVLSSAILQIQGFGALAGIAIVVACLTVSQMAYLAGVFRRASGLFQKQKQADKESGQGRNNDVAANQTSNKSSHPPERRRSAAHPSICSLPGGQNSGPCPDSLDRSVQPLQVGPSQT